MGLLLLPILALSLAACENCSCPSAADTKLTLPHVRAVTALDPILAKVPTTSASGLQSVAPYHGAAAPDASRALLTIQGAVFAVDLSAATGSATPVATRPEECRGSVLTADDRYLACAGTDDTSVSPCDAPCGGNVLTLTSLSTSWPPILTVQQRLVASTFGELYSSPTWSPDGRHLAVIDAVSNGQTTAVDLLARRDGGNTMAVSGYLRLRPDQVSRIYQVAWSPDGAYLAVLLSSGYPAELDVDLLSAKAIPTDALTDTAHPPTITFAPQRLSRTWNTWMTWTPDSKGITFPGTSGLETITVPSGTLAATLSTLPSNRSAHMGPFVWLGDGRSLLFSYGPREEFQALTASSPLLAVAHSPGACACVFPPAVIYVYTAS